MPFSNKALVSAIKENNIAQANLILDQMFITQTKDSKFTDFIDSTPDQKYCIALQTAVEKGQLQIIKKLLKINQLQESIESIEAVYQNYRKKLEKSDEKAHTAHAHN